MLSYLTGQPHTLSHLILLQVAQVQAQCTSNSCYPTTGRMPHETLLMGLLYLYNGALWPATMRARETCMHDSRKSIHCYIYIIDMHTIEVTFSQP